MLVLFISLNYLDWSGVLNSCLRLDYNFTKSDESTQKIKYHHRHNAGSYGELFELIWSSCAFWRVISGQFKMRYLGTISKVTKLVQCENI